MQRKITLPKIQRKIGEIYAQKIFAGAKPSR